MPGIKHRDHRPANLFPGTIVKTAKALAIPPGVPAVADFIHILFSPRIPQCGIAR
jgi:hypothetical protein